MDEYELLARAHKELPPRVCDKILWVYDRRHFDVISVAFRAVDGSEKHIDISRKDWLNDAAVARLCLECL